MKRIGALFLCVCMLLAACGAAAAANKSEGRDFRAELTGGMWHASPSLGSGWSSRLALLDDSTFIYAENEMDAETRERFVTGEWSVSPDGLLTLLCRETLKWEGGEVVPATASTATETEIINAVMVKLRHDPAKKVEIRVGDYIDDDNVPHRRKISLPDAGAIWGGDGWWWKYEGDWDLDELRNTYKSVAETVN